MANKLNAFLASVPANGLPSPVRPHAPSSAPTTGTASLPTLQTSFPDLAFKAEPAPTTPLPRSHAAQPATPQPQRRRGNRRGKKFETHFHKSESARNISFSSALASSSGRKDSNADDDSGAASSNQDESAEQPKHRQQAISLLKAFDPKQRSGNGKASCGAPGDSEAGPLRRLSAQGSHHRRVSTDTTMFNRYLRQQADRDINTDVVQHFSAVPVVTLSRPASTTASGDDELDNNNSDDNTTVEKSSDAAAAVLDPHAVLAVFERGGTLSVASALELLKLATNVMSLEPNVLALRAPCTLVGDLHGQFQDLRAIFGVHGAPSCTNPFLFLGDYVDRGVSSCEIVLLLLAFKVAFPASVHLLRGNHECRSLSTFYGFRAECLRKYGTLVYNRMIKCFESMPLAAKLETSYGVFLAVHGGLSPAIARVDDINERVNRFMEPEPNGALCDLLWADPAKDNAAQTEAWAPNSVRGCSFTFNERACRDFLAANGLLAIIRAHELEEDGFREHFGGDKRRASGAAAHSDDEATDDAHALALPPVITVFSAPEYCNTNHNMGATLVVSWEQRTPVLEYRQHARSAHREHEFTLASEDDAVKAFLRDALPFLPADFYDLVAHCRQLKHMLTLSKQSSMSQLQAALADANTGTSTGTGSSTGSKAAFALALDSEISASTTQTPDPPRDPQTNTHSASFDRKSRISDSHTTTTEEQSATEGSHAGSTPFATASAQSARQSRRKQQQHRSHHNEPLPVAPQPAPPVTLHPFGNVQVLTRDGSAAAVKAPPQRSHTRTFFVASGGNNDADDDDVLDDDSASPRPSARQSLTAVPMNNQLNSSDDVASPAASPSAVASVTSPSLLLASATSTSTMMAVAASHVSPPEPTEAPMQLESMFPGYKPKGADVFSKREWQALKLYFTLLDIAGNGVLMEESFVVLLAEQDSDAYATEDELTLLMEVIDTNADGLITEQDFLLFAYRLYLQWKKTHKTPALS